MAREESSVGGEATTDAFRRLPEPVRTEETVASSRGDHSLPEPIGEPNVFIATAVRAGG